MNELEAKVGRLQKYLRTIRKVAGWTVEELGERIGVTKQTITNIENGKVRLTKTQYLAIRGVLDFEISHNKENTVLPLIVDILINGNSSNEQLNNEKISSSIEAIAASAYGGITGASLGVVASALLGPLGVATGVIAGSTIGGLAHLGIKNKNSVKRSCNTEDREINDFIQIDEEEQDFMDNEEWHEMYAEDYGAVTYDEDKIFEKIAREVDYNIGILCEELEQSKS